MLDSMVASSRPTRAEVADVANAILDGTDAVMLSQESAVGQYPVEAIAMMAAIAERTELTAPYREWNEHRVRRDRRDPAYTIAYTACRAAHELGLAALVCPTLSGRSARLISAHRPTVPIYALSPGRETVRRCGLMWGVQAASMQRYEVTEELDPRGRRARRRARLGQARRARRHHGRPAVGEAGDDEPAPDPGGLTSRRSSARPTQRHHHEHRRRDDRLRRAPGRRTTRRAPCRRTPAGRRRARSPPRTPAAAAASARPRS